MSEAERSTGIRRRVCGQPQRLTCAATYGGSGRRRLDGAIEEIAAAVEQELGAAMR